MVCGLNTAWPRPAPAAASSYSIKAEFACSEVLLTGASGYIGSVVLEQLLRTTDVGRVHLLMRPRKGQTIQERAHKLLQGALFHKVRDNASLLSKVVVVGGDISLPGLGLSPSDRAALSSSVNFIIHCAADIRLEADIQETLTSNYEGTRTVLELAASAQCLRGLVHVSSAFVNMNVPRGSIIDEAVYPLRLGRQVVDVEQIAKELLESAKAEANQRAETYKQLWNFPNTYTLGKHMSEQLVTRYQAQLQLPVAIVRPSLTSAIAGEPYPGYVGNWAGPIGAAAAMAVGMFDTVTSVASQPTGVWDVVPADLVASSILAAAAAVSAGAAAAISQATQSGTVQGTAAERRVVLGYPHPLSAAVRAPQLLGQGGGQAAGDVASKIIAKVQLNATAQASVAVAPPHDGMDTTAARDQHNDQHSDQQSDQHSNQHSALYRSNSSGSSSGSPRLLATAVHDGKSEGLTSSSSASSSVVECEVDGEQQQQGGMPLLILHAATSSTYPLVLMESWNYMLDFLEAHPAPFRMAFGKLQRMTADFEPNTAAVMSARRRVGWKVWALAGLMRWMGKEREARKLEVGFDAFCVQNNSKTDRQLVFATDALVALQAAMDPSEASEYMLVWRPVTNRGVTTAGRDQQEISTAAKSQLAPVHGDLTWKRYLNTQMAGVYKAVFGVEVPQRQPTAAAALAAAAGAELGEEDYIVHDFKRIR